MKMMNSSYYLTAATASKTVGGASSSSRRRAFGFSPPKPLHQQKNHPLISFPNPPHAYARGRGIGLFPSIPTPSSSSFILRSSPKLVDTNLSSPPLVQDNTVSVVLLAGGKGKRMGAAMPKQYLPLLGQPIALYSFFTFSQMTQVKEIVVVCDPSYAHIFQEAAQTVAVHLKFALPGKERQDSVFSGLQEIDSNSHLVCIHDSARPLVTSSDVEKVLNDGWINGAAVLGVPAKATIKEADSKSFVVRTLDRKTLWEMQTPQVIKPELLKKGFELVNREGLEVTDDVSIVEHLKQPVYISEGSYTNIKVTTPDDLLLAERILSLNQGESSEAK
ncbi:hypothetical protein Tsubulata_010306 [Turnera subulata]|uniref:2-C-methyl-D-erythritol 4-phosphate cytidylyltransferase, chloroplastic n=1 Tax=Turnera subulata TaxID=218843 RepID=A0A9Q0GBX2_9ROSI|nr:hypothetical protein Tsubulata_010306 [Turnera subulata]